MSDFVEQPIKKLMNEENPITRIERVEELTGASPSSKVNSMDEVANDMGIFGGGSNELVFTPEGVESVLPTSTDFTGTFVSGDGYEFNSELYNIGGVNEGVLQWGARQDDGKMKAGAGKVVLDASGVSIVYFDESVDAVKFYAEDGTTLLWRMFNNSNALPAPSVVTESIVDKNSLMNLHVFSPSGKLSNLDIQAADSNNTGNTVSIKKTITTFNDVGVDVDFVVESENNANMLVVDAGLDAVGVAGAAESGYELKVTGEAKVTERLTSSGFLNIPSSGDLTISGGVITATGSAHRVDTQGGAATDDLDTINGGSDGDILILQTVSSARDVTVKDATGNLRLAGDFVMTNVNDRIMLRLSGSNWVELCRSDND